MLRQDLIEALAALAHGMWAGWVGWMFEKWDETYVNGECFQDRWRRQMVTSYGDLSEAEKESDRVEAKRMLEVFEGFFAHGPMMIQNAYIAIQFQDGPIKEHGVNGCQIDDVLEICAEKLREFNRRLPCEETTAALIHVLESLLWLNKRTLRRQRDGVEGTEMAHISDGDPVVRR